jgi:undecaprenyl diphosphate synthase
MHGLNHLAIIMDGNRRWAAERGMPQAEGHRAGIHALERVVRGCLENGISYLTLYAFSTENWRRTEEEVTYLLDLMEDYLGQILHAGLASDLFRRVNFTARGDMRRFRPSIVKIIEGLAARDNHDSNINVAIAVNYGSRAEIVEGINRLLEAGVSRIDEERFAEYLDHHGFPDPDLMVRTSGVHRLSNFLLWQSAYSEFLFIDEKWPDLTEESIAGFVEEYRRRERRYGT